MLVFFPPISDSIRSELRAETPSFWGSELAMLMIATSFVLKGVKLSPKTFRLQEQNDRTSVI